MQQSTGTLVLSVGAQPAASADRRLPSYVSPSTSSVGISINGAAATYADVSASSPNCTTSGTVRTCTVPVAAPIGPAAFALSLYDAQNGGGKLLGKGTGSTTVVLGQPFSLAIAAGPLVGGLGAATLNYSTGTSLTIGTVASATGTLGALDPDSNAIPAPATFATPPTLTSSDPHVTVSPATWTSPSQTITIAYDGSTAVSQSAVIAIASGGSTIAVYPLFATNLLVNGNAEADTGAPDNNTIVTPTGWTTTGQFTSVQYGASGGFPDNTSPGPTDRRKNFFAGGNVALSTAAQTVSLSAIAASIDTGARSFVLSAWLGGYSTQDDNATVTVVFQNATAATLATYTIGPATQADRGGNTAFVYKSASASVPVGTRAAIVTITATRLQGTYNDGYADDVSLVLL